MSTKLDKFKRMTTLLLEAAAPNGSVLDAKKLASARSDAAELAKLFQVPSWDAGPYVCIWRDTYGGPLNIGAVAGHLKSMEFEHGRQAVIDGWRNYCSNQSPKFASIWDFIRKPKRWLEKLEAKPVTERW